MSALSKNAIDILLAESFKELAIAKPIEKITIKEITDKAGVIRPTFYNHFQDKYELIEMIITKEILEPAAPLINAGMITEAMVLMFTNIQKEMDFYKRAVKLEGAVSFHAIAMKCVKDFLQDVIEQKVGKNTSKFKWLDADVLSTYYAQSMCFATEELINMGMTMDPREMAEAYQYIISHSMTDVIEDMSK